MFINCPFDSDYQQTFRALIFAIYACGFRPRSALELDDNGQARLDKIFRLIDECRYGIHDLSRTELDAANALPRFNMPLELGIFLGAKRFGGSKHERKYALILDVEQYRYQMFISDLAGMDIHAHHGDPITAIRQSRDWLTNVSRRQIPSGDRLAILYQQFVAQLPGIAANLEFDVEAIPYVDFERIVTAWLVESKPVQ